MLVWIASIADGELVLNPKRCKLLFQNRRLLLSTMRPPVVTNGIDAAVSVEIVRLVAVALVVFRLVAKRLVEVAFVEVEKLVKRLAIVEDAVE